MARGSIAKRAAVAGVGNGADTAGGSASSSSASLNGAAAASSSRTDHSSSPTPDASRRPVPRPASPLVKSSTSVFAGVQPTAPSKSEVVCVETTSAALTLAHTPHQQDLSLDSSSRSLRKTPSFCNDPNDSNNNLSSHKSGVTQTSILPQHPLIDSLTIFILIIQFPNLIVSFIHLLFACLTFVSPTPSPLSSSLISSLTHATPASPSLLTIFFADITVAVISIFVLPRMRSIMVDLGSAVIASALGGGGSKTAIYCTSLLQLARIVRHSLFLIRRGTLPPPVSTAPSPVVSVSAVAEIALQPTPQYYLATGTSVVPRTWDLLYGSAGWFSQAIAVHIVGQSLMHSIRRMFLEHENRLSSMPAASSSPGMLSDSYGFDYEAATYQSLPQSQSSSTASFPPQNGAAAAMNKKKKKSGSTRHQQQSLWSALANTLVLASRDSSQLRSDPSTTSSDHAQNGGHQQEDDNQSLLSSLISDDYSATGLGYRPSVTEPALYSCVRYILENEVAFEIMPGQPVTPASAPAPVQTSGSVQEQGSSSILSTSLVPSIFSHQDPTQVVSGAQPHNARASLYVGVSVRVNGILWPEVSVQTIVPKAHHPAIAGVTSDPDPTVRLLEDAVADEPLDGSVATQDSSEAFAETLLVVSGLTPITEYEVEVCKTFKNGRQVTICRTNICTSPKDPSAVSSQQHQPSRPLSPVTTLLDTLCTTNSTLTDEKQKLKRARRDHSKHLSALRSDIDSLKARLGAGDKGDERAWRRVLALRESVRRTEEEIESLSRRTEELEREERSVSSDIDSRRAEWVAKMRELECYEAGFRAKQEQASRKERGLHADEAAIQSKRDKLAARHRKLMADFQRADQERRTAWEQEFARRKLQREQLAERRQAIEEEFSNAITKMEKGIDDIRERTSGTWQSVSLLNENATGAVASVATSPTSVPATVPVGAAVVAHDVTASPQDL
ncbi:hypothetical protein POJ06DRAFT_223612 [Lipomyces tetrasporus]|uniref:Ubiquitination network signaling protein n=1 Tax=Lipomyces tetrasporus TaxID=54092 RepID=A0AAD7VT41_9ASCO|nr:uncharacterized protein POJ06DRAFT_223612 [Lipomyces tetrasporus]KAJ8099730.1 hypothetical protein POJ06DRAFT_223612 [Lipomyces tetrasporus]